MMNNPSDSLSMATFGSQPMTTIPSFSDDNFFNSPQTTTSPEAIPNVHLPTPPGTNESEPKRPSPPQPQLSPTSGQPPSSHLNPRSCTTCRKRKVRCDKRHPCANCTKASIECIFPGPGRAPRRSRKPPDSELLARLRRLEGVVQSLGKGADEAEEHHDADAADGPSPISVENGDEDGCKKEDSEKAPTRFMAHMAENSATKAPDPDEKLVKEFGRLVVEDGRSRYVSNKFWSSLGEEIAEMRDILDDPTDEEEDYPSPGSGSSASANHQGWIFNFSSTITSLRTFHPPAMQVMTYWEIYKERVDPVARIFHRPSTEKIVKEVAHNLDHVSKPTEVMMFSIYYAVITSMAPTECQTILGLDKDDALKKYRFGVEQSLARVGFLSTSEMIVVQSFTLFLTCVRRSDITRYVWTLTGLVLRLALSLGLHRDGQKFGLSPFETEMRRRLWWQIVALDTRASEDHGTDPSINESLYDTKFPLNIDDEDLNPDMKDSPQEHDGWTEETFDLIRCTVTTSVRRFNWAPAGPGPCRKKEATITLEDKEKLIEELHQYIENKYLKLCDLTVPLQWVCATVTRLIMAKFWLIIHHPFQREDRGEFMPQEVKDRMFLTSLEVIEFSYLLETERATAKWGWLFRTYIQWHAVAYVLSQLTIRTSGPQVDKAWSIIELVFDEWGGVVGARKRGMLWKPLRKLMAKARAVRSQTLQKQAMFPLDGSLGPIKTSMDTSQPACIPATNTGFTPMPLNQGLPLETNIQPEAMVPQLSGVDSVNGSMNSIDQWLMDDSTGIPDPFTADGGASWAGWDNMVKDYQFEANNEAGDDRGQVMAGMTNWW